MKKINKVLVGLFALSMLFTLFSANNVLAAGGSPVEISGDTVQTQIHANNRTAITFRNRTQLRINSSVDIDVNINCEALRIGVKSFEIEIECDQNLQMNMTCTEEQAELGLLKGNTFQIRNRNRSRYRFQEGFCLLIQCNYSNQFQAKLKMQVTNENHLSSWAYYDEISEEWVAVPTTIEDGYLITETDHFSYWTILSPELEDNTMIMVVVIGLISVVAIVAIVSVIFLKKRK